MRLELTIERSYQIQSHNRLFKMTGLVRRFSKRRNLSSSRIHCCYIYIGTEFKGKHILEQDELFCCAIISSGLKDKKVFYVTETKDCRKKKVCPFFLLENSRSLSSLWEPQTPLSSSGTLDFLSSYLRIDFLSMIWPRIWETYNGQERREAMKAVKAALLQDCQQQWERSFIHSPFMRLPFQKL